MPTASMLTLHRPPTSAALALSIALAGGALIAPLAGCGSSAAKHARDERRMLAALAEARDAVCGCRDLACAEDAEQRLADFLLLHVDSLKKIPAARSTSAGADTSATSVANQAARLDGELRACKHQLEEAATAS